MECKRPRKEYEEQIESFETENGFLGTTLPKNEIVEIEVSYEGTKIMKISMLISVISFTAFVIYIWKKH